VCASPDLKGWLVAKELRGAGGCVCSPRLSGLKYRKSRRQVGWSVQVSAIIPFVLLGAWRVSFGGQALSA